MVVADFEGLLKRSMGLDAASIGSSAVERAVRERQRVKHLEHRSDYWDYVSTFEAELQALIEAVVVPETWFFRDHQAFTELSRFVEQTWAPAHPTSTLRLLSVPCATGEEPYSMAMALLDAGLPAHRFRIDAVDISERALARGRLGVYRPNAFREPPMDFRNRHFEELAGEYRIEGSIIRQVRFQQGNLFDSHFLPGKDLYDVIFCRNVLIYFDRETQDRTIHILSRLLTPHGLLFVGPSETAVFQAHAFDQIKRAHTFALRKRDPALTTSEKIAHVAPASPRPTIGSHVVTAKSAPRRPAAPAARTTINRPASPAQPIVASVVGLEEALRLADQGHFVEAARHCEDHLRQHGPSADAFHLLGLVRDASGDHADAASYYRKALYLNPHHRDALVHLALLMERANRGPEAKLLMGRASRVEQAGA